MATPKDLPRDIGGFIRDLRQSARISLRQLAEQTGVSNPYLSQIERGLRKPSAEVLQQLASALRVSTPAMYLRAGLLDSEGQQGVIAAIAVDPELTIAQKQSLTQIYETFRGENARHASAGAPIEDVPVEDDVPVEHTPVEHTPAEHDAAEHDAADTPAADEAPGREAEPELQAALVESVAALDNGATPAPVSAEDTTTADITTTAAPAKKATRRAATKAVPTAQEEKS
jgi:transcriptional regulator with XRE-family HTH domain